MPIIKLGGPRKFFHLKKWASELPTLRTTDLHHTVQGRNGFWIFCSELLEQHLVFPIGLKLQESTQSLRRTFTGLTCW